MGKRDDKKSPRQKMQDAMSTSRGQTILNYAYNWGAAIVIMGALFKLIHLPGANIMLCVGMGTEVLIFFISAFDLSGVKRGKQIDKSTDFIDLPSNGAKPMENDSQENSILVSSTPDTVSVVSGSQSVITVSPEMEQITTAYIEQLKAMTDMLAHCTAQAATVTNDALQMDALSKNLAGINAIYEMQLRSASTQITTIDQVHEQTRLMAQQIEELNKVYARMLQAMTPSV